MSFISESREGRSLSSPYPNDIPDEISKVLKNTYLATFIGLLVAAFSGYFLTDALMPHSAFLLLPVALSTIILMFVTMWRSESPDGLFWYLAFMAAEGMMIGWIVGLYMTNFSSAVFSAAISTAVIFFSLSAYVIISKKDLNHWGGYLSVALISLLIGSIVSIIFGSSLGMIITSGFGAAIFSLFILYDTSRILHGMERNYVRAATAISLNIICLFIDLLEIFAIFGDD